MIKALKRIDQKVWLVGFNIIEFFDLFLFVHLASLINPVFLGDVSPTFQKIFQFSSIYLITPLALIYFAHKGDIKGRKHVLLQTTSIIVISSILMAAIPAFEIKGLIGAGAYLLLRVVQGIGMAGEPMAAKMYAIEDTEDDLSKIPFWVQWLTNAQSFGGILALLSGIIILRFELPLVSALYVIPVLSILALFVRKLASETQEFSGYSSEKVKRNRFNPYNQKQFQTLLKSLPHARSNFIYYILLTGLPFIFFIYNYVELTPHILKACNIYSSLRVMEHNLGVQIITVFLSSCVTFLFYKTSIRPAKVVAFTFLLSLCCLCILNTFNYEAERIYLYMALQGMMQGFLFWNMIYGQLLRAAPINIRFKFTAYGWSIARLASFVFAVWLFPYITSEHGIECLAWIVGLYMVFLALPAALLHKPYDEIEKMPIPALGVNK